jgi:AAA15 family ATPase/GTPase
LHDFSKDEWSELKNFNYLISWLDEILIDETDSLKYKGHKLGRSASFLYFRDKYMRKNNNIFAAENSNEGVLNILFYLALLISRKTPKFFAIDNIESSLNPKLCRTLMKIISNLAIEQNKQILITTHNPAILDGINLFDERQRLFIVKREDEGNTKVERLKLKPEIKEKDLKLSEMWMRGYLGALPNNF